MNKRKICVITGTRAEYGLLRWLMLNIKNDSEVELQVIVTGMHLSIEFGLTYKTIIEDGFKIDRKVEMLTSSDTSVGIAKSMGLGMIGFADALNDLQPDLIVVLGDRFEIFAAVSAALVARFPVAHLHGGETSQGSFDEALRHSITKMSHLHFVAAREYQQRIMQLGENPKQIHLVGALGLDNIEKLRLLGRAELEASIDFKLGSKNLLITFHPATLEASTAEIQMKELLKALDMLKDTHLIFTLPNADTDSLSLINLIKEFIANRPNANLYKSLGNLRYLSCISHVDGVVGNSSSGLIEVPSLNKGTINIGDRQLGRLQADSVINCDPTCQSITNALGVLYSKKFQSMITNVVNPYGTKGASDRVFRILKKVSISKIVKKKFYDLSLK